jgi:hypothetical protein
MDERENTIKTVIVTIACCITTIVIACVMIVQKKEMIALENDYCQTVLPGS